MSTIAIALEATRKHRCRRNRDVVEEAEAHRTIGFSVMSWRTYQRKRGLSLRNRVLGRLYGRPCSEQRDIVRIRRRECIGIEHDRLTRRLTAIRWTCAAVWTRRSSSTWLAAVP